MPGRMFDYIIPILSFTCAGTFCRFSDSKRILTFLILIFTLSNCIFIDFYQPKIQAGFYSQYEVEGIFYVIQTIGAGSYIYNDMKIGGYITRYSEGELQATGPWFKDHGSEVIYGTNAAKSWGLLRAKNMDFIILTKDMHIRGVIPLGMVVLWPPMSMEAFEKFEDEIFFSLVWENQDFKLYRVKVIPDENLPS